MNTFFAQLNNTYDKLINKMQSWIDASILLLPNIILAAIIGVISYLFSTYVKRVSKSTARRFTRNKTVLNLFSNLATVVFGIISLFVILSILDLDETINKILATAGVLGLAIGLALQDPMNNLFSGVFMSVRKLYNIGDLVETNGYFGTIKDIDLRATKLELPSGQYVIIPNKEVIQKPLKNFTTSGKRRINISCGVSYADNLDKVEKVIKSAISNMPSSASKEIEMIFTEFGDSSVNFELRFWIDINKNYSYLEEKSKAIKLIKQTLDEEDITIPFPVRTIDFDIKGGESLAEVLSYQKDFSLHTN